MLTVTFAQVCLLHIANHLLYHTLQVPVMRCQITSHQRCCSRMHAEGVETEHLIHEMCDLAEMILAVFLSRVQTTPIIVLLPEKIKVIT